MSGTSLVNSAESSILNETAADILDAILRVGVTSDFTNNVEVASEGGNRSSLNSQMRISLDQSQVANTVGGETVSSGDRTVYSNDGYFVRFLL